MGRFRLKSEDPARLNASRAEAGLPLQFLAKLRNVLLSEGPYTNRMGQLRVVGDLDCESSSLYLNSCDTGVASYVRFPLNLEVHQLPVRFTMHLVLAPQALGSSSDQVNVLSFDGGDQPFRLRWTGTNQLAFSLTDANGIEYTLSSLQAFGTAAGDIIPVTIVRDGAYLAMIVSSTVEGVIQASRNDLSPNVGCIAPSGDLIIGTTDLTTEAFCGRVDEFRILHAFIKGQKNAFTSWENPRDPAVVAYYRFNPVYQTQEVSDLSADPIVIDDSRYGNHGAIASGSFDDGLVDDLSPVVGLIEYNPTGAQKKLVWASGESIFTSPIG